MTEQRVSHPSERVLEKSYFKYSKFKASFYTKLNLDANTRKIIKFINSMQGS